MIPKVGQRWLWCYGARSTTIVEIIKIGVSIAKVTIVEVKKTDSRSIDCVGGEFAIDLPRFNTAEFEYLSGQDTPHHV